MSAMIDVVFLLLVFFVIVVKPRDIIAGLEVCRPRGQDTPPVVKPRLVRVTVHRDGYTLNGRNVSIERIDEYLARLAGYSTNTPITVTSTADAPHSGLVKVLDKCKKSHLWDLRVFSL